MLDGALLEVLALVFLGTVAVSVPTVIATCLLLGVLEWLVNGPVPRPRVLVESAAWRKRQRRRCPFCHDDIDAAPLELAACPGCATELHADCWRELGRCPVLGCDARAGGGW